MIFALLFGGQLYGFIGAFIALPIAAIAARDRRLPAPPPRARAVADARRGGRARPGVGDRARRRCPECGAPGAPGAACCAACGTELGGADEAAAAASAGAVVIGRAPTAPRAAEASRSPTATAARCRTSPSPRAAGERLAVIGPNGAGKTTLLSILAGLARADRRHGVAGRTRERRLGPAAAGGLPKLSVAENLRLFARLEQVADADATVDADARADRPRASAPATSSARCPAATASG